MRVLVACEFSGTVRDAFIAKGHDAVSCDLLPTEKEGPHIQGDVLAHLDDGWDLLIAHPPCTYLTRAGEKWFKPEFRERFPDRPKRREEAAAFFLTLWNAPIPKVCIENPRGIMSSRLRRPHQVIQPYEFGHPERKATCLWLKGLPGLMATALKALSPDPAVSQRLHYLPPSADRWKERSKTFPGIAKAMAEQWG